MNIIKTGVLCLLGGCAMASMTHAGGFSRGDADTDILYEDGTFVVRGGATWVSPQRDFDTIGGAAGTDDVYSDNYVIPSAAAKLRISDNFSCAFTYTQPFGASSSYGTQSQVADITQDILNGRPTNAVIEAGFDSNEYGGTCAANFDAGRGQAYLIGGLFIQDFDYTETKTLGTLNLKDSGELGYRLGAAYEIKEYALRAEILYRSQIEHEAKGTFTAAAPILPPIIMPGTVLDATGTGTLPQSLELNLQSGIAPGWLAFGTIKWTDWSVLQTLNYDIDLIGPQTKDFFWRDGWTVSGGVGHVFNEKVSGALSLTWDRGVDTGADIMTDTWTVGLGTQIKAGPGTLRFGGAVSYLTAGSQSTADGANFDATANGDWAYAVSGNYKISF